MYIWNLMIKVFLVYWDIVGIGFNKIKSVFEEYIEYFFGFLIFYKYGYFKRMIWKLFRKKIVL